jgi:hypothetical protein
MPRIGVDHCRRTFVDDIAHVRRFVVEAEQYRKPNAQGGFDHIGPRRVEELAGLAMLRALLGWETLVQDSFVRYLCGARTASGYQPVLVGARQRSIATATTMLLHGNNYITWSVNNTLQRANVHFARGGEPYATAIGSVRGVLNEMVAVRNRIAHASDHAAAEFAAVVRGRIGFMPTGMTPGRFLLTPLGYPLNQTGGPYIDLYVNSLLAGAATLVP